MTALERYERLEAPGRYFDGRSAAAAEVIVKFGDASLILMRFDETPLAHWSLSGLRDLGEGGAALSLTPDEASEERLLLSDPDMVAAIRAVCPRLGARRPVERPRWRRALLWGAAALASIWLIVFHLAPALADRLATLIPPEAEQAMGEEMTGQFARVIAGGEPRFCEGGPGGAALARLTARLERGAGAHLPLRVRVLDAPMINAFALPGGRIVLFRGLLRAAESPEAVAGVLAHEIGHVVARDPTRLALRAAGSAGLVGLLLGDFTGATATVALTEALLRSGYQREAESAADDFATALLAEEGLPAAPLAGFFAKLGKSEGGVFQHLASHPDPAARAARVGAADKVGAAPFTPALSDQDWVALRNICR